MDGDTLTCQSKLGNVSFIDCNLHWFLRNGSFFHLRKDSCYGFWRYCSNGLLYCKGRILTLYKSQSESFLIPHYEALSSIHPITGYDLLVTLNGSNLRDYCSLYDLIVILAVYFIPKAAVITHCFLAALQIIFWIVKLIWIHILEAFNL